MAAEAAEAEEACAAAETGAVDAAVDVEGDNAVLAALVGEVEPVMVPMLKDSPERRFSEAIFASTIDAIYALTSSGNVFSGVSSEIVIIEKLADDDEDDDEDEDEDVDDKTELEDETSRVVEVALELEIEFDGLSLPSSWSLLPKSSRSESVSSTRARSIATTGATSKPCRRFSCCFVHARTCTASCNVSMTGDRKDLFLLYEPHCVGTLEGAGESRSRALFSSCVRSTDRTYWSWSLSSLSQSLSRTRAKSNPAIRGASDVAAAPVVVGTKK